MIERTVAKVAIAAAGTVAVLVAVASLCVECSLGKRCNGSEWC